jgi:hypothetical protein
MNSHFRMQEVHQTLPLDDNNAVKRALPDWLAAAMLFVAAAMTVVWAGFLLWLPGHLLDIW